MQYVVIALNLAIVFAVLSLAVWFLSSAALKSVKTNKLRKELES